MPPIRNLGLQKAFGIGQWLLIILGFLLRLAPLGRYVTPDEPAWVYRSIRFGDALSARDWAAVPSTGHPGATTMWLGAAGVAVQRLLDPAGSAAHLDWIRRLDWLTPENGEAFRHLAFFLPWGRVAVALVTTLGLFLLYPLLARLFDRRVALLTVGLLAFDPFLTGHSGLLHTDALLATFSFIALATALNGLREPLRGVWWASAGFFAGLALLTKTLALILPPFILLLLAIHHLRLAPRKYSPFIVHCSLFIASLLVTFFVLYPALWADPLEVGRALSGFAGRRVKEALQPVFFLGQMTYSPGPFFYPVVFLFRVSPIVLIGIIIGLVTLRRLSPRSGRDAGPYGTMPNRRFAFLTLLAFAILLGAGMSLGAKKHDRYLLPAFPPLALAAALGIGKWIDEYALWAGTPFGRVHIPNLLIIFQALIALVFVAYPLGYCNPLLGGPLVADRVLAVDWGEGMGAAARQLNRLPDAGQLTVTASNVPSFASFFEGRTIPLDDNTVSLADYIVTVSTDDQSTTIYTNTAPFEQTAYLAAHAEPDDLILLDADTPLARRYEGPGVLLSAARPKGVPNEVAVADWLAQRIPGRETVWLVALPGASPITAAHLRRQVEAIATPVNTATVASATITEFATRNAQRAQPATSAPSYRAAFGAQLALVDGALPETIAWPDPLQVTLRWQAPTRPKGAPTDYQAVVALRDRTGYTWDTAESPVRNDVNFPTSAWTAGEWSDATYQLRLPPGIPPGRYAVEASLYDKTTGAGLGATGPDGAFQGTRVVVGEVTITPPTIPPDTAALKVPEQLSISAGPLTLLGWEPPATQALSGDRLSFTFFWQADAAPEADYHVRLRLAGSDDQSGLETAIPLSPYPTSSWRAGDRFQSHHNLHILPHLSPGRYHLALNVLDTESDPLWKQDQSLATVEVLPRERSFTLPDEIPHRLDLTFGKWRLAKPPYREKIHLRGYDLTEMEAAPGETLALTLYWQADGPAGRDYTLFVHLLGPDGLPHGQVDRTPGDGSAPTSSWAAGQVIVEQVALPVAADAPPGAYHIAVGFYDASYGGRLPITDTAGQPLPDDRAILPLKVTVTGDSQ